MLQIRIEAKICEASIGHPHPSYVDPRGTDCIKSYKRVHTTSPFLICTAGQLVNQAGFVSELNETAVTLMTWFSPSLDFQVFSQF